MGFPWDEGECTQMKIALEMSSRAILVTVVTQNGHGFIREEES
jgi:hypothetical protein